MKTRKVVEDSALQAGWIFADLFLALTVIFLATVSFIPRETSNVSDTKSSNSQSVKPANLSANKVLISNGFIGEYKIGATNRFVIDFQDYLTKKGVGQNTKAIFMEVVGHSSEFGVGNENGNVDAIKFVISARKLLPENLNGVATSVNLSPEVAAGYVRIKVTFV